MSWLTTTHLPALRRNEHVFFRIHFETIGFSFLNAADFGFVLSPAVFANFGYVSLF